jgi:hypothetical protein
LILTRTIFVFPLQNTEGFLQDILLTNNLHEVVDFIFTIKLLILFIFYKKRESWR